MRSKIFIFSIVLMFLCVSKTFPQGISETELKSNQSSKETPVIIEQDKSSNTPIKKEEGVKTSANDIDEKYLKDGTPHTNLNKVKDQIEQTEAELSKKVLDDLRQ